MSPSSFVTLAFTCAVLIAAVSAVPVAVKAGSTCAVLQPGLPSFCTCADGADLAATLTCSMNPMGLDQMTATGSVAPCKSSGATIDLSVKDTKFGVSYTFPEFASNTNGSLPVPGKTSRLRAHVFFNPPDPLCSVPGISLSTPFGSAGVYADYAISGDASDVNFDLSVDLCVATMFLTTCASTLGVPGMPVTIIKGSFDFSSICT